MISATGYICGGSGPSNVTYHESPRRLRGSSPAVAAVALLAPVPFELQFNCDIPTTGN